MVKKTETKPVRKRNKDKDGYHAGGSASAGAGKDANGRKVKGGGGARQTRRQTTRLLNPSDPLTTELALNATLKSMGLYASKTVGDGNCMFRALSDQIWGVDEGHGRLRQEICDYMEAHPKSFEGFVDTERPFDHYLAVMRQRGTYGGHMELTAFARAKGRAVKVIMPDYVYIILPREESPTPLDDSNRNTLRALPVNTRDSDLHHRAEGNAAASSSSSSNVPVGGVQEDEGGMVYVSYHIFEHYSSVRNLGGPHTGPPRIKEIPQAVEHHQHQQADATFDPDLEHSLEIIARSLPPGHGVDPADIRARLKRDGGVEWETVLDELLSEIQEDQSEEIEGSKGSQTRVLGGDEEDGDSIESDEPPGLSRSPRHRERPIKPMGRPSVVRSTPPNNTSHGILREGTMLGDDDDTTTSTTSARDWVSVASTSTASGSTPPSLSVDGQIEATSGETDQAGMVKLTATRPVKKRQLTGLSIGDRGIKERLTKSRGNRVLATPLSPSRSMSKSQSQQLSQQQQYQQHQQQRATSQPQGSPTSATTLSAQQQQSQSQAVPRVTKRTFPVLGKNLQHLDPSALPQTKSSSADPGPNPHASGLTGKEKRTARKRRVEVSRREAIEAAAWGISGDEDEDDTKTSGKTSGRRTRGSARAGSQAINATGVEGQVKGIKELYI